MPIVARSLGVTADGAFAFLLSSSAPRRVVVPGKTKQLTTDGVLFPELGTFVGFYASFS